MIGEQAKLCLLALCASENALTLLEFVERTQLPIAVVASCLDFLVAIRILQSAESFHRSEIGDITYFFAENDQAQMVYEAVMQEE